MATIKMCTDIPQSKKLAEFLPLESADMWYQHTGISIKDGSEKPIYFPMVIRDCETDYDIPCWSLAALLSILPKIEHLKPFIDLSPELDSNKVAIYYHSEDSPYIIKDNLMDAVFEMILWLKENNKL